MEKWDCEQQHPQHHPGKEEAGETGKVESREGRGRETEPLLKLKRVGKKKEKKKENWRLGKKRMEMGQKVRRENRRD